MKDSEIILKALEELKEVIYTRYKVRKIGLFGSYLKEMQKESSDIDLLVDFSDDADLIDFVGLALFLEEKLKRKVDIVPVRALREELKEHIQRETAYV